MEDNKKRKPNSHECLNSWSELPLDLLNVVFNRLCFIDFKRAKSVCSSWLSASKQSTAKKNHTPWLILFPEDHSKKDGCCTLLNPEEKQILYKTQDMGLDFAKSVCKATYGTWLLMQDLYYNLYIVNLFTKERIILPSMESQLGVTKGKRTKPRSRIVSSLFWIDEKTKDYVVLCIVDYLPVVYSKKLNNSWKQIPKTSDCYDMVYKDHKLYLRCDDRFIIFDFYGESPQQTFKGELIVGSVHSRKINSRLRIVATKLVVTVTGNVLLVQKIWRSISMTWSFLVIKVYSSDENLREHQLVNSLGNESMLFDQGITVLANETDGFISNSIYFSAYDDKRDKRDLFLFNLKTHKTELMHKCDYSSSQFSRAQWFLPSLTHA